MRILAISALILLIFISTGSSDGLVVLEDLSDTITCTDSACFGSYQGPEFISGSDIAHQFSNTMSGVVGDKLKELYRQKIFVKVDFENIEMTTAGMGSGRVTYYLFIPFERVQNPCDAYTSFDHVGGWNHAPALVARKRQLQKALFDGDVLNISDLRTTPEGLQEYWIQWRNKHTQANCEGVPQSN